MPNEMVTFEPPRLPYVEVVGERFGDLGVTKTTWKALVEAVWPTAKTIDGVILALSYCQSRKLDPFKKPVHVVPVWSSTLGREVEGVWPGISELRTTAMRTGSYAGCDETEFGPDVVRDYAWSDRRGEHKATVTFPEWARATVYRLIGKTRVPFVGPKVYWGETYATASRTTDAPNDMWRKRPRGQIEKCSEAGALRKAFPEEIGNEYAAEEMAGRVVGIDGAPISAAETVTAGPKRLHAGFTEAPESLDVVLEGDDIPEPPADINVDPPAPVPEVVKDLTPPDEPAPPADPLAMDIVGASPDEQVAWAEALRATIMRQKTADGALAIWRQRFESHVKPLSEANSRLYDQLDAWMESRVRKLRGQEKAAG